MANNIIEIISMVLGSSIVLYDEINNVEYPLPQDWIVDNEPFVFKGITFEEADDLSLVFKGITFEVADRKLMDSLFFAQT